MARRIYRNLIGIVEKHQAPDLDRGEKTPMGNIDGLKAQVEDLKQRFTRSPDQPSTEADELKSRLASIKANLEGKRQEISRLVAEKERLAADLQRATAENDQLRKMLAEVLAVIDGQSSNDATMILREFLAETDPLIQVAGDGDGGGGEARAEDRSADQRAEIADPEAPDPEVSDPEVSDRGRPAHDDAPEQGSRSPGGEAGRGEAGSGEAGRGAPQAAIPLGSDVHGDDAGETESPALRRILKRGNRAG
jgi:hypothetical protein